MMIQNLVTLNGGEPVLAGAANGRAAFASLVRSIDREPGEPSPLFLDFGDVDVATASYLRESIFALKGHLRHVGSNYYPVAANPRESVYDELLTIANAKNDAIISCELSRSGVVSNVVLIGHLDPKQQLTFDLVTELKRADANLLMEHLGEDEQVKSTAWNNRLAGLAARGLIREYAKGRAKFYRPVLEAND
jgi:hypothetical protein